MFVHRCCTAVVAYLMVLSPLTLTAEEPTPVVGKATPVMNLAWQHHSLGLITTGKFNGLGQWIFTVGNGSRLVGCELNQLTRMPNHANSMVIGGKPERIVLGTNVGTVVVRDGATFDEIKTLAVGPEYSVYAVAIDAAGEQIAACGVDGTVLVWNADAGKPRYRFEKCSREGERMAALAFSPDGTALVTLSRYGYLAWWNLDTGRSLGAIDRVGGEQTQLQFTPDGHRVVLVDLAIIRLWHPTLESKPREIVPPEEVCPRYTLEEDERDNSRPSFGNSIRFAGVSALSTDGKRVASILETGGVGIWELGTQKMIKTLAPPPFVAQWDRGSSYFNHIAFSPDGSKIAACTSLGDLAVWTTE